MAQYTKSVIAARGEEEEEVKVLNLGVIKYFVLWCFSPVLMGCRTGASHMRVVGGKWSLLRQMVPTYLPNRVQQQERCQCVAPLVAQP